MTDQPSDDTTGAPAVDPTVLDGRPLIAASNGTRGRCTRCLRKNAIRRELDRPDLVRDPSFADGARVRLLAAAGDGPDGGSRAAPPEQCWRITDCFHADHALPPREDLGRPGVAQVHVRATVRAAGWTYQVTPADPAAVEHDPDALVIEDVEVEWYSSPAAGTPPAGCAVAPETGLRVLPPDEPRPDWPAETDAWRERFVRREGPVGKRG